MTPFTFSGAFRRMRHPKLLVGTVLPVALVTLWGTFQGLRYRLPSLHTSLSSPVFPQEGASKNLNLGCGVQLSMIFIPSGNFQMGSPSSEADRSDDEGQHGVRISHGFWMGRYDVTQAQWQAVMGNEPSSFNDHLKGPDLPMVQVSWDDCQRFILRLNGQGKGTFRLPTEAEWEYACRAGSLGPRYGDLDAIAWHLGNSDYETHPGGGKKPNAFGLYDMQGNVWQWCQDWYGPYHGTVWQWCRDHSLFRDGFQVDPQGARSGPGRVIRGGAWSLDAPDCRSAYRYYHPQDYQNSNLGLRIVSSLPVIPRPR